MKLVNYIIQSDGPIDLLFDKDGSNFRAVRIPGDSISDLPKAARDEINEVWTPEFIASFKQKQIDDAKEFEPVIDLERQYSDAIQSHLDATAQQRRYDGIQTAITYRNDPNPQFAAEGEALFEWRSACWTYSTAELAKVEAGERGIPTVDEFISELPAFEWPVMKENGDE